MNRKLILSACILAAMNNASATIVTPGATVTTGPTSDGHSVFSATSNPAVAALTVDSDEHWRVSYLPSISFSTELGDVNDFVDEVDDLIDILDDPSLTDDSVEETLDRFNNVLEQFGDQGYLKFSSKVTAPLLPVYWQPGFLPGTMFAEASVSTQWRVGLLDHVLAFDDVKQTFGTNSSGYVKSGIQTHVGLGYAQELFAKDEVDSDKGRLYGGIKANIYKLDLSKQVLWLQQLDGEDIEDYVEDAYDNNLKSTTNLGLDLGFTWVKEKYRAGVTVKNINAPSFDYGAIGVDCEPIAEGSFERGNCEVAKFFANRGDLKTNEKHTMHPGVTVDGTFYILKNWSVSSSVDLAAYDDIVGTENQWLGASTSFNTKSFWIPDMRLGYHKNLAGSEISTVAVGLSFFDTVTFDAEMGLEDVEVDGSKAPRKIAFSIAFEEKF